MAMLLGLLQSCLGLHRKYSPQPTLTIRICTFTVTLESKSVERTTHAMAIAIEVNPGSKSTTVCSFSSRSADEGVRLGRHRLHIALLILILLVAHKPRHSAGLRYNHPSNPKNLSTPPLPSLNPIAGHHFKHLLTPTTCPKHHNHHQPHPKSHKTNTQNSQFKPDPHHHPIH
jgi:hypothetical protein